MPDAGASTARRKQPFAWLVTRLTTVRCVQCRARIPRDEAVRIRAGLGLHDTVVACRWCAP